MSNGNKTYAQSIDLLNFIKSNGNPNLVITEEIFSNIRDYPIQMKFYGFGLCIEGYSKIRIDLKDYEVKKNCLVFFKPNQVSEVFHLEKPGEGYLLAFTKDFISSTHIFIDITRTFQFLDPTSVPLIQLSPADATNIKDRIIELNDVNSQKNHPFRQNIMNHLVLSLLYEIEYIYSKTNYLPLKKRTRKEELAAKFYDCLLKNYKKEHSVQFYANVLCITPKYLSELLQEVYGKSALQLIHEMLALEAKFLLSEKKYNLCQIAEVLKFSSTSSFVKFFKRVTGTTPGVYRSTA